jgi:hypothetical protein
MLLIKDEEESCEEVGPLVVLEPLEEVIMVFLGEKYIDKLVTLVLEPDRDHRSLSWRFSRIAFIIPILKKGSNSGDSPLVRRDE